MGNPLQLLLQVLPGAIRKIVTLNGNEDIHEVRLRVGKPAELVKTGHSQWTKHIVTREDISFLINTATKYSPWTSHSISEGYVTTQGGHRIGICGYCSYDGGVIKNINHISSVCIRVAKECPNIAAAFYNCKNSMLIIGKPGAGKTTFLRDLLRGMSEYHEEAIVTVDERCEIFPIINGQSVFEQGKRTDVLSGCRKPKGIDMALRTMSPQTIAMDEITDSDDCAALLNGAWCGVRLIATAHAGNREELFSRPVYKPILSNHIFQTLIVLHSDQTWHEEKLL